MVVWKDSLDRDGIGLFGYFIFFNGDSQEDKEISLLFY